MVGLLVNNVNGWVHVGGNLTYILSSFLELLAAEYIREMNTWIFISHCYPSLVNLFISFMVDRSLAVLNKSSKTKETKAEKQKESRCYNKLLTTERRQESKITGCWNSSLWPCILLARLTQSLTSASTIY